MYRRVAVVLFAIWVLTGVLGVAQSHAQGAAAFQTIVVDPYSQALGEATVALRGYPGAASVNPASIGRPQTVQIGSNWDTSEGGLFQTPWLPGFTTFLSITSPSVDVRLKRWAFAYQFKQMTLDDFEFRDAQNNLLGSSDLKDRSHKVVVAYDLRPNFTIGLGLNLIQSEFNTVVVGSGLDFEDASTVSLDLGLVYDMAFEVPSGTLKPSLGWSLMDFGGPISYGDDSRFGEQEDPLTMMMRGGLSVRYETNAGHLRRPLITVGLHGALSKTLVGVDDNFEPYGPFEALIKAWKPIEIRSNPINDEFAEFKKVGTLDQLITHAGLELSVLRIAYLRFGDFHEPTYVGGRQFSTFGFGIDLYYVALDYSKASGDDSPLDGTTFWRFTARVPLTSSPDNFWPDLLKVF